MTERVRETKKNRTRTLRGTRGVLTARTSRHRPRTDVMARVGTVHCSNSTARVYNANNTAGARIVVRNERVKFEITYFVIRHYVKTKQQPPRVSRGTATFVITDRSRHTTSRRVRYRIRGNRLSVVSR